MLTLYGITNCDTVRSARKWLKDNDVKYVFHDFRKGSLELARVNCWIQHASLDTVINKRSTTWKKLDEETRQTLLEGEELALLIKEPTLMKRPILEQITNNKTTLLHFGFKAGDYQNLFSEQLSQTA